VKYLVDANVLSEATKPQVNEAALHWMNKNADQLYVNPVILGELRYGIVLLPRGRKRSLLLEWFKQGVRTLSILSIDEETSQEWAELLAELRRKGRSMPVKDSLIAATARQYNMTVVTRNTSDYQHAKVKLINPFSPG